MATVKNNVVIIKHIERLGWLKAITDQCNVRVLSDTADFYRFFDARPHEEFPYACVRKTIKGDLPN